MWRHLTLVVLLFCVPAQYFVTKIWNSKGSTFYLQRTFSSLDSALHLQHWSQWPQKIILCAKRLLFDPTGEHSPAVLDGETDADDDSELHGEVNAPQPPPASPTPRIKVHASKEALEEEPFDEKEHFGGSTVPRSPRDPEAVFHVGQIVTHKLNKYRGVIVAWDRRPKMPAGIAAQMFSKDPKVKEQPFYTVLVDTRDRVAPQIDYAAQEALVLLPVTVIIHPVLREYFESDYPDYETGRYKMRPALREIFPED